jgi:hypothetical protein
MTKLIGINGFKRSGKGQTAIFLSEIMEDEIVYEIGFADKLKIMAALALGFERSPRELIALMDQFKLDGEITVAYTEASGEPDFLHDLTGRELLQNFGNHARHTFGENFWIDQVLPYPAIDYIDGIPYDSDDPGRELTAMYGSDIGVVAITDLRYPNEAERIKALGGVIWEVVRPGVGSDGHASEQPLPEHLVDFKIVNDGDLDTLKARVIEAVEATL